MEKIRNVLVIAPLYHAFVKGLADATANYTSSITVFVHHNYFSELAPHFPFPYFRYVEKFSKEKLVDLKRKPENVNVNVISMLYFAPDGRNIGLGDKIFLKFDKYIKNNNIKFDLIHAHFTWPSGYAGVKLAKKYNVPVVITEHENREWFLKEYRSKNEKIYWTWRNADALIRVNKIDVPFLREFNPIVCSIPNGFDPYKFRVIDREEARARLGLLVDQKIIFSLGNLIERKGFQYLIEAMKNCVKVRSDILCLIGGGGPLKEELEKQIKELDLQDYIRLLGFVPDDQLAYWVNAADFFVLPSLSEGNPTVMFEALGVGLPFVGTSVGGIPEIITSEDYGLLVEPANPEDLSEKILIALEKVWDAEKIRIYAEQFTWDNIAKEVVKVYRNVLL
jgi:teichuronic acid biosynthesis glycosyltransferase TuaC